MSAISACISRNGRSVDTTEIELMLAASSRFNRHGSSHKILPSAAFGANHFWTTSESRGTSQPLHHAESDHYLLFEGRIDNREELIGALKINKSEAIKTSDAELFMRAYLAWNVAGLGRVVGPFACVIYNERNKTTTLARDAVGNRSLFYFFSAKILVAASEQASVMAHPEVPRELNEAQMAVFFAMSEYPNSDTYFKQVSTLLPGQYLIVSPDRVKTDFHWQLDFTKRERFKNEEDYVHRFLELTQISVDCRLRRCAEPGAMVSGGMDSAPVAALAARRIASEGNQTLKVYTWAFEHYPECDERHYVNDLCRKYPMQQRPVFCDDATPLSDLQNWPVHPCMPEQSAYYWFHDRVYEAAAHDKVDILLTGFSGDDLYGYMRGWFWDGLRDSEFTFLRRETQTRVRNTGLASFVKHDFCAGLFTDDFLTFVRKYNHSEWLNGHGKRLLPNQEQWLNWKGHPRRKAQTKALFSLRTAQGFAAERHFSVAHGVDVRNPFRDRRLLEFVPSIPPSLLTSSELSRPIARAAFKDILPASILERRDKTTFAAIYRRGLIDELPPSINSALSSKSGLHAHYLLPEWLGMTRGTDGELMVNWAAVSSMLWMKQAFPENARDG